MYNEEQPDRTGSLSMIGYQDVVKSLLSNFGMDLSAEPVSLENTLQRIYQNKEQCIFNSHIHCFLHNWMISLDWSLRKLETREIFKGNGRSQWF